MQKIVILDNIRSAHNVGSIFRTCDAAGVSKIYLCGYTPAPIDRFGRAQSEITKTSLGATETVGWECREKIEDLLTALKKEGVTIAAVEQGKDAVSYKNWQQKGSTAFIFGNEVDGISDEVYKASDVVLEIKMQGTKESLNVSVAAGVVLFQYT
ncbi:TrmH family RNA methyltransferase [Candidatus Pacebacteria bacterium]|nr:TrmH family RNA methyltransferase [Candidatus Paceibacterota bacterium]